MEPCLSRATSSSFRFHLPTCRLRSGGPVIVISNDAYNHASSDIIVVAMTSNPAVVPYSFRLTADDLVEGSLNRPGTVRVDKIYTLAKSIVVKEFW